MLFRSCRDVGGSANVPNCFNGTNMHAHGLWVNPAGNGDNVLISIDPGAIFQGRGDFTISGHVAATSGVKSVTISAVIDGADTPTVLGTATVGADGTYTFLDHVGRHLQGFITATQTDNTGNTLSVQSPYSLQAGLHTRGGFVTDQDLYSADGNTFVSRTQYRPGGTSRVKDRKSTRLNSSHSGESRMPSSA